MARYRIKQKYIDGVPQHAYYIEFYKELEVPRTQWSVFGPLRNPEVVKDWTPIMIGPASEFTSIEDAEEFIERRLKPTPTTEYKVVKEYG